MVSEKKAQKEVQRIVQKNGQGLYLNFPSAPLVIEDDYGDVESRRKGQEIPLKSFPTQPSPTDRQREKAGLSDKSQVIFYLSAYELKQKGLSFKDIDLKEMTVTWPRKDGHRHKIIDKNQVSPFGENFLYVTLGCRR